MISDIKRADLQTWWLIAKADPQATFYQTPAWLEVAQRMDVRYQNASLQGTLSSGTKFVFPLTSYSRQWPVNRLYSVFDYCYGGVISDRPLTNEEHEAILQKLPLTIFTHFNLVEPPGLPSRNVPPAFTVENYTSSLLDLTGRSFEDVVSNFSRTHRGNYRKTIKEGITVRPANHDQLDAEFKIFYEIYLATLKNRWQDENMGLSFSPSFWTGFAEVMQAYPENMFLWFAEKDGEPISAEIDFVWNGRLNSWSTVSRPAYFKHKPTIALLAGIIKNAIDLGVTTFDFGPNLGKQGLEDFKRRFGAETIQYNTWEKQSPIIALIDKIRSFNRHVTD